MLVGEFLFWGLIFVLLYVYVGYPCLLPLISKRKSRPQMEGATFEPSVSLLVTAHNEARSIEAKIRNALQSRYPREKLQIIVASDCSTDDTDEIVQAYAKHGVVLKRLGQRGGKTRAQNHALECAIGDIIVFSDATSLFEPGTIRELVKHFQDERVGGVIGSIAWANAKECGVSEACHVATRYEAFIRRHEGSLGVLASGSGAIMAIRSSLISEMPHMFSEDFFLPLTVLEKGHQVRYAPQAIAREIAPTTAGGEFRIRARNARMDCGALLYMSSLLNPLRYPMVSFSLLSHRVGRWVAPYALLVLYATNAVLAGTSFYASMFMAQCLFYLSGIIGGLVVNKMAARALALHAPWYFCLVNLAMLVGVTGALVGKRQTMWEPVR